MFVSSKRITDSNNSTFASINYGDKGREEEMSPFNSFVYTKVELATVKLMRALPELNLNKNNIYMNKVSENPFKNRTSGTSDTLLIIVTALFVTLYLTSNIMAVKVIGLAGLFYFDASNDTTTPLSVSMVYPRKDK